MKRILLFIFILCSLQSFGAKILTPFGYKEETSLNVGDMVIGEHGYINFITGKRTLDEAWFHDQKNVYEWYSINGEYHFFGNQNIIVAHGKYGVCHVSELKKGWSIYNDHGEEVVIKTIRKININLIWYRFDISGDHTYISDEILLHNATRFWVGGGSSTNWSATSNTNWSATSGGSNNATVPGASDDVTFNGVGGSSNGASVVSANITILSLTFAPGYTNTITENSAVVLTIAGNFTDNTAHSWTVNSVSLSALTISATSSINSGGKTWPGNVSFSGANTKTLVTNNWTITGALTSAANTTLNWTTAETLTIGGLTISGGTLSGTAKVIITSGTWSGSSAISNSLDINGNVTVSGSVAYNTGTLTYVSGTVTTTSSTLTIAASTTLNTNGITWNNITVLAGNTTLTLNSTLSASGILQLNTSSNVVFAGSFGFSIGTLTANHTGAFTLTFNDGVTYTITTALNAFTSRTGSIVTFTSDDATNKAILTLNQGATCNVLANFTRIDASGGRTIRSFNGTITNCLNILAFNDIGTSKN